MGDTTLNMAAMVILKKLHAAVTDAPLPGIESTKYADPAVYTILLCH